MQLCPCRGWGLRILQLEQFAHLSSKKTMDIAKRVKAEIQENIAAVGELASASSSSVNSGLQGVSAQPYKRMRKKGKDIKATISVAAPIDDW